MHTPTPSCILQIHGLGFAYTGQAPLASDFSASIGPGLTLLQGDTGSGKSSLLRVLAGTLPAEGQLTLAGSSLARDPEAYRSHVFFCDPSAEVFDPLTVHACTAALRTDDPDFHEATWQALVEGFALAPHLDKKMYMLSTGSRRKVGLAAALASGRALTLLDEPTGALDNASVRCLWTALTHLAQHPTRAIIVATAEAVDPALRATRLTLPLR